MNAQRTAPKGAPQIVYYQDETNEDFSGIVRPPFEIGASYPYRRKNPFWKLASFFVYRICMTPFAFLYSKIKFGYRIVNRKALREAGKSGCFLYGNHTLLAGDAFLPSLVSFPRKTSVVVNADNLAVPLTRGWIQMSGAIPVPTLQSGMRRFLDALEKEMLLGHNVQIYPEAHVWPYYTGIRRFSSGSFRYPIRFDVPVYCTTTTFQKKRFGKTPRVTVYVDGPFYADPSLPDRKKAEQLCDRVYQTMCERAKNSTYTPIRYVKREATDASTDGKGETT